MTNVMIVDDEILVRIGLRSTISWDDFGFTVTADAANGMQAIEKFELADPDILITDIRMPGMDGMELIKVLKQKKPQLKIVILTNYDNFEYAKQALGLGADEYLLKTTLDNQSLLPILKKLQDEISQEKERNLAYQQLQKKAMMGLSYLKKQFTEHLLMGKISPEEWSQSLKDLNLKWESHSLLLVLIKGKLRHEEINTSQSLQFIEEIAEKIHGALVWESQSSLEWVIIYNFAPDEIDNYTKQVIPFNLRQIKNCLQQYLQIGIVAMVGRPMSNYNQIPDEWDNLMKLSEYRIFWPEQEMLFYGNIPEPHPFSLPLSYSEKNLTQYMKHAEFKQVQVVLDELFSKMAEALSPELLRQIWHELIGIIFRLVRENGLCLTDILSIQEQSGSFIDTFNSIPELKEWFLQKFLILMKQGQNQNLKTYSFPIRQAILYLEERYHQDVTLITLANYVGLSKNHLCTLFRDETGLNFVDFLHQIRIEHARELLETTDLRVSEVGLKVGYMDPKYFTKVFQKYLNCSPSEYREKSNN